MKLKGLYLILMMNIGTMLMAQEKYDHAVVTDLHSAQLIVSIEGKELKTERLGKEIVLNDLSPLFKQLKSMENEGWEVWNSSTTVDNAGGIVVSYFLRRKLK